MYSLRRTLANPRVVVLMLSSVHVLLRAGNHRRANIAQREDRQPCLLSRKIDRSDDPSGRLPREIPAPTPNLYRLSCLVQQLLIIEAETEF